MSEIDKLYKKANVEKDGGIDEFYPEFTAEKQLEIVKFILFSKWWLNLKRLEFSEKFNEGLAQMINELWQSITETERTQIKNILGR